jgi:hypothetical protein
MTKNFGYIGLFISVLILLGMLVCCHLSYYFDKKVLIQSDFIDLALPKGTLPLIYNQISYSNALKKIPCEIMPQAQIPCNLRQQCSQQSSQSSQLSQLSQYQLSDSELALLYKEAYEKAGLETMLRTLNETTTTLPATTTTSRATTTTTTLPATNTTSRATTTTTTLPATTMTTRTI